MCASVSFLITASLMALGTALLSDRANGGPDQLLCNIGRFGAAEVRWLSTDYLRNHDPSTATLGYQQGGGWCSRLSCEYSSGIYACNDNEFDIVISLSDVADFADDIINNQTCHSMERQGKTNLVLVQGQAFNYTGGWNVIVGIAEGEAC